MGHDVRDSELFVNVRFDNTAMLNVKGGVCRPFSRFPKGAPAVMTGWVASYSERQWTEDDKPEEHSTADL